MKGAFKGRHFKEGKRPNSVGALGLRRRGSTADGGGACRSLEEGPGQSFFNPHRRAREEIVLLVLKNAGDADVRSPLTYRCCDAKSVTTVTTGCGDVEQRIGGSDGELEDGGEWKRHSEPVAKTVDL